MGDLKVAQTLFPSDRPSFHTQEPAHVSRYLAVRAQIAVMVGAPDARDRVAEAIAFAAREGAALWSDYCQVLLAVISEDTGAGIRRISHQSPVFLSLAAEVLIARLRDLDESSMGLIFAEAEARPDRWRTSVRRSAPPTIRIRTDRRRLRSLIER